MERPRSIAVILVVFAFAVVASTVPVLAFQEEPGTATPTAVDADPGSLVAMLGRAPDMLAGPNLPKERIATYSNIATQLAAVGLEAPTSIDDEAALSDWLRAVRSLIFPDPMGQSWAGEEWRETYGFEVFQVEQALQIGDGEGELTTFLRGRFDEQALFAAWERSGYRLVDISGGVAWVGDLPRRELNHAAILPDGTLVFGSSLVGVRRAIAVAAGREPSLADRPDVATLLGNAETDLASALLLNGEALHRVPMEFNPRMRAEDVRAISAALDAAGTLPPVELALLGVTPGGPLFVRPSRSGQPTPTPEPPRGQSAHLTISLLMEEVVAAEAAVPVVAARLATVPSTDALVPYAELFAGISVQAAPGAPVVVIEFDFTEDGQLTVTNWLDLYLFADLLFIVW